MAKKGKAAHGGGHGWFVTFADLMGLLVSFFVMLVAFSTQDKPKLQIVAGSMREAFGTQSKVRYSGIVEIDGLPSKPRLKYTTQNPEEASETPTPDEKDSSAESGAKQQDRSFALAAASLRQALQTQQEELQLLKEELAKRDRQIDEAREEAAAANSKAAAASSKATEAVAASTAATSSTEALSSSVTALKTSNDALVTTVANANSGASQLANADDGPVAIRYKGVSITPGGFLAAETVFRNRATGGDIATPFTGIPFESNDLSHVTESAFTGRQSRLSMLVQSKVGSAALTGYVEADFLGAGTTSNNRQTNSYVFRQRQLFARPCTMASWNLSNCA